MTDDAAPKTHKIEIPPGFGWFQPEIVIPSPGDGKIILIRDVYQKLIAPGIATVIEYLIVDAPPSTTQENQS